MIVLLLAVTVAVMAWEPKSERTTAVDLQNRLAALNAKVDEISNVATLELHEKCPR